MQGETLAQSNEISNLRKDLQALGGETREFIDNTKRQEQAMKAKVAKKESVVTRTVKKAAFPDLTKRPWLRQSVIGRFFQLANQWYAYDIVSFERWRFTVASALILEYIQRNKRGAEAERGIREPKPIRPYIEQSDHQPR